ncbi:hypothetical protein AXG93_2931s1760 [Marchantia polymorpha subsp. ruderalis]|uniref:Uncharacterized protein n=1 Tax=Marchantia polymorpha subsp. ruderalis TaxID=1480154 RepID=A0A176VX60_MARPO|nr:hypothetical protein AXG93_2931s1760 [Marchantia polymorpha subsp. ruderalis]
MLEPREKTKEMSSSLVGQQVTESVQTRFLKTFSLVTFLFLVPKPDDTLAVLTIDPGKGSYIIVNIYGSLHGENGANIEDGLWVLLGNKAGDAFWGKASKPLTAETPVKVWIVR